MEEMCVAIFLAHWGLFLIVYGGDEDVTIDDILRLLGIILSVYWRRIYVDVVIIIVVSSPDIKLMGYEMEQRRNQYGYFG